MLDIHLYWMKGKRCHEGLIFLSNTRDKTMEKNNNNQGDYLSTDNCYKQTS